MMSTIPGSPAPHRASPVARRIAAASRVDISTIAGSGPSGRVMKADVLQARPGAIPVPEPRASAPVAAVPALQTGAFQSLELLGEPYELTAMEADLTQVAATSRAGAQNLDFVVLAAVGALARHPLLNGAWSDDGLIVRRRVHLQLARANGARALVRDAQDLNLRGMARALRRGEPVGLADSTFTIADFGAGPRWAMPPIGAGHSAALGVIASRARPVVVNQAGVDSVAVRPIALLILAYDARMLGQPYADAFLRDVRRTLEAGAFQ